MIRNALLTMLAALLLYSGLIYYFRSDITRTGQTVGQRNLVKAEEYRYEAANRYDTILVGSSMSERIVMGNGCYNLAMAGLSAQAGLRLIRESNHQPHLIYVESNTLLSAVTLAQLPTGSDSPAWRFIRQQLPFTRQKYQPVGVFKAVLRDWQYGKNPPVHQETGSRVDSSFLNKAIIPQMQERQHPLPDSVLRERVQTVWQQLNFFKKQGTQLILFEMPVDPRIQQMAFSRSIQTALRDACRASGFPFIIPPATDTYQTTDGVHLTTSESIRYTRYLCDQLRRQRL